MTLGNHGWSHKNFQTLSWDQAHDELWRVEEAFIKASTRDPADHPSTPLSRPWLTESSYP